MSQEQEKVKAKKPVASGGVNTTRRDEISAAETIEKLDKLTGKVRVTSGASDQTFDNIVGQKVGTVRASLVSVFNIPADAQAFVNGKPVEDGYILQDGQQVEFIKKAGVKGKSLLHKDLRQNSRN